jgi:hypothetical protein
MPVNIILRDRPLYWVSQDSDVSGGLRQKSVNAEWYMAIEQFDLAEAVLRPATQSLEGPVVKARIYVTDLECVVFSMQDSAQCTARCARRMYKDQTHVVASGAIHNRD